MPAPASSASSLAQCSARVEVHSAQGLKASDYTGTSDPYVAVKYGNMLVGKTAIKKRTVSPDWGQNILFGPVCVGRQIFIEVWDCDPLGYDECLGCVALNVENTAIVKKNFPFEPSSQPRTS